MTSGSCPMGYGNNMNPDNMMPDNLAQTQESPDQSRPLSTERVASSIPKSSSGEKWVYPSPQQFFNALRRKEKSADEESMDSVVFVHNFVNEKTWKEICEWEKFNNCANPALRRFIGRSEDLSPKAWIKQLWLGKPFDRHDWFVDRCGKETVRYVIDYYDAPSGDDLDILIDTRPALDSFSALKSRIWKFLS